MIEDEISTDPFIQNTLQKYPNEEWNRVLKALTVLGIQTLNNSSPQDKVYTVDELEQLINAQPSSSQEQMKESQQIEIQQEEELNSNSEPGVVNKDIEQHIIHHVQESNDIEQSQPTKLEELHEKIEINQQQQQFPEQNKPQTMIDNSASVEMKQPINYNYQNVNVSNSYSRPNPLRNSYGSYSPQVEENSRSFRYTYRQEEPPCQHHSCCCNHHCYDGCVYCRCYCTSCILRRSRMYSYTTTTPVASSISPRLNFNYSSTSYTPTKRFGYSYQMN